GRVEGEERTLYAAAVAAIKAETHPETVGRLDAFLEQARQAARQEKAGRTPDQRPGELLALAVSGWLQGSAAAETRFDTARKLWDARKMVLGYLRAETNGERERAVREYTTQKNTLGIDEIAQLISLLPPPRAEEKLPEGVSEQKADRFSYLLQLPPEYHPARPYPLLTVLHNASEDPR